MGPHLPFMDQWRAKSWLTFLHREVLISNHVTLCHVNGLELLQVWDLLFRDVGHGDHAIAVLKFAKHPVTVDSVKNLTTPK